MCNMVGNLLTNYRTQQKLSDHLIDIIHHPDIIDLSFDRFLSENDFRRSVRILLEEILENERQEKMNNEEISFIAIGMDKQEYLAPRYGSDTLRNVQGDGASHAGERTGMVYTMRAISRLCR